MRMRWPRRMPVDFGDLVLLAAQALEQNPDLRAEYQARFEHILVDEYQDVNLASARLVAGARGTASRCLGRCR